MGGSNVERGPKKVSRKPHSLEQSCYGNTKRCVNFGHNKAHNRFAHSQLNSDSILSLKNEENLTILLTVLSYLKTHRSLGQQCRSGGDSSNGGIIESPILKPVHPCVLLCLVKLILGKCFITSEPRGTLPRSEIAEIPPQPVPP